VFEDRTLGAFFAFYKHARLYTRNERNVLSLFANTATLTLQNAWMYNQVEQGYLNLALELANTVDLREFAHAEVRWKLAELAEKTALRLQVPEREVAAIHWAALLHDIGKKDVPAEVLRKSGPLNEAEWKLLHDAPLSAERMLKPVPHLQEVAKVVRNYRERYDGSGYPDKLRGDQIPVGAKVLAVVDAYTSMLRDRPYQKPRVHNEALEEIQRHSGTQFDPAVVNAFNQVMARAI
jgi:HD-GYP domain-containing protein (c-di-GMP phosphodiesterase class II)